MARRVPVWSRTNIRPAASGVRPSNGSTHPRSSQRVFDPSSSKAGVSVDTVTAGAHVGSTTNGVRNASHVAHGTHSPRKASHGGYALPGSPAHGIKSYRGTAIAAAAATHQTNANASCLIVPSCFQAISP